MAGLALGNRQLGIALSLVAYLVFVSQGVAMVVERYGPARRRR
jgi:hypothetical protein